MKSTAQLDTLAVAIAMIAAAASLAALGVQVVVGEDVSPWLIGGAVAGGLAGLASAVLLVRFASRPRDALRDFVEQLRETCPQHISGDFAQHLPPVEGAGPQHQPLHDLREYLVALASSWQQAESDRARAEVRYRRLVGEYEQLNDILQSVAEPVMAIDEFDELAMANASARSLFGLHDNGAESRALATLIRSERLVELLKDTRRRQGTTTRTAELEIGEDGDRRFYSAAVTNLANRNGSDQARGAVAVLRDISEQRAIQKRHAEFVASVSHEMKTPLASIKAYVELLADGEAEDVETRDEFLDIINGQTDRLQRLIENLLNISRIEAGVVDVDKQQHSLNEVLEEALGVVQPAAEQKNQTLVGELSPLFLGVLIDRDMILQTAINLLSNAVKYTPEGGIVTLRSRASEDQVNFEVQDTGVGLSEADKQNAFSKYYRVKKDRRMADGTGLGLPLAKHIVEDVHGGWLTVESVEGEGSTFRVSLPRIKVKTASPACASH